MTSLYSRVKSSTIRAVKTGRGLQSPVTLQTEQVVNSAGERDSQVVPPTQQDQTHGAGFRGFNPKMTGGNSLQKSVLSSAAAGRRKPKARRPGLSAIPSGGLRSRPPDASRSGAASSGPAGSWEGRPRPRDASPGWRPAAPPQSL